MKQVTYSYVDDVYYFGTKDVITGDIREIYGAFYPLYFNFRFIRDVLGLYYITPMSVIMLEK